MKGSTTVYWTSLTGGKKTISTEFLQNTPDPLYKDLYTNYLNSNLTKTPESPYFYFKCPAAKEHLKNTFIVRNPLHFDIEIHPSKTKYRYNTNFKDLIHARSLQDRFFNLNYFHIFFTEDDITMSQFAPSYHNTEYKKYTTMFGGEFNISKWFRPVHSAFILNDNKLKVKKGDPLYYIKFNTDKKVKLKHFNMTSLLREYELSNLNYKLFNPKASFKILYDLFLSRNYNKRILKEIKNNLTGY